MPSTASPVELAWSIWAIALMPAAAWNVAQAALDVRAARTRRRDRRPLWAAWWWLVVSVALSVVLAAFLGLGIIALVQPARPVAVQGQEVQASLLSALLLFAALACITVALLFPVVARRRIEAASVRRRRAT